MSDLFADRLIEAIAAKNAPICVGIDPVYEMLPRRSRRAWKSAQCQRCEACVDAIFAFTTKSSASWRRSFRA
jgi:hypothetical protein